MGWFHGFFEPHSCEMWEKRSCLVGYSEGAVRALRSRANTRCPADSYEMGPEVGKDTSVSCVRRSLPGCWHMGGERGRRLGPHPNTLVLPPRKEDAGDHEWKSPTCHHTEQPTVRARLCHFIGQPQRPKIATHHFESVLICQIY